MELEKRDLYDINRKPLGETIYKGEDVPDGKYIIVVLVFIQNSEGKFLTQKRSQRKNGLFATTGGHPKSGEDSIQGIITEVKEEIGVDLKPEDLQLFFAGREDSEHVFFDDYYIKMDIPNIDELELQEEEVESLHWFSAEEMHELNDNGKYFKNHFEEFERLEEWLKKQ